MKIRSNDLHQNAWILFFVCFNSEHFLQIKALPPFALPFIIIANPKGGLRPAAAITHVLQRLLWAVFAVGWTALLPMPTWKAVQSVWAGGLVSVFSKNTLDRSEEHTSELQSRI